MLDIAFIRDNQQRVHDSAAAKGIDVDIDRLIRLDSDRRQLIERIEEKRQQRNEHAANLATSKPSPEDILRGKTLKHELAELESQLQPLQKDFDELLAAVPNVATEDTPIGSSESENVVAEQWGDKPEFEFTPRNHWEIAEARGWIDKERAARIAGSRFAYIKGDLVMLQMSLMRYGLDVLTDSQTLAAIIDQNNLDVSDKAFVPVLPPLVLKTEPYKASGRLNAEETTYQLVDDDLWLNASAEHPLCTMYLDEILDEKDLPLRYVGYATSFRREAGTYGKDMEGILRMHQFDKLEMESFSTPETSLNEHFFLIAIQEYLMQQLELPYQKLLKCTADIGFPNARGVDLEVWLPGQERYRETHTADYITDFQARGTQTRFRRGSEVEYVHTNDATAFSQRPLIGIIENNQTEDMKVRIPAVLRQYMGGRELI